MIDYICIYIFNFACYIVVYSRFVGKLCKANYEREFGIWFSSIPTFSLDTYLYAYKDTTEN